MSARVLDGKRVAHEVRSEVRARAAELRAAGVVPGLAFVLVGDDPASAVYVRSKGQACEEAGFHSVTERLPPAATQAEVLAVVERFNADERIHGMLVQLPLPEGLDEHAVLEAVDPAKDVDGFHP
ncbi:MAG: tetrahydrofolate dehydrogenase/cyclohydrolase catalytic domain-containing protein, partial [Gemmatimonadota bacterium]